MGPADRRRAGQVVGQRDQLVGKLRERYGYAKEQAEREVEDFCRTCD